MNTLYAVLLSFSFAGGGGGGGSSYMYTLDECKTHVEQAFAANPDADTKYGACVGRNGFKVRYEPGKGWVETT